MQSAQGWATKNMPGAIDGARDRRIEARDRNAPINANQIRLQTSRIRQERRPIRYHLPARLSFRQGQVASMNSLVGLVTIV
jgi:hypothetical protein